MRDDTAFYHAALSKQGADHTKVVRNCGIGRNNYSRIAQSVEQSLHMGKRVGSNPTLTTKQC